MIHGPRLRRGISFRGVRGLHYGEGQNFLNGSDFLSMNENFNFFSQQNLWIKYQAMHNCPVYYLRI